MNPSLPSDCIESMYAHFSDMSHRQWRKRRRGRAVDRSSYHRAMETLIWMHEMVVPFEALCAGLPIQITYKDSNSGKS
jgi:hypothetical protein